MANKQDRFYFENFIDASEFCCEAAAYLKECLDNYDFTNIKEMMQKMHTIENNADKKRHEMSEVLAKAFVTPFDREDISQISYSIDEVADALDEVLQRFYMDDVEAVIPEANEFADKLVSCCTIMKDLFVELQNYKKPAKIHEFSRMIGDIEEECDRIYIEATHDLKDKFDDALTIVGWRKVLDALEKCADACEHVGDSVVTIVIKNS